MVRIWVPAHTLNTTVRSANRSAGQLEQKQAEIARAKAEKAAMQARLEHIESKVLHSNGQTDRTVAELVAQARERESARCSGARRSSSAGASLCCAKRKRLCAG